MSGDWRAALGVLNKAIALSPNYTPALIEKAKVLLVSDVPDWDQATVMAKVRPRVAGGGR